MLGCDRVSVARWRAGRARLLAVSGVDEIESRSNAVTCLEALCTRVAQSREPLAYQAGHTDSLPPQLEEVLNAYVDHEHARSVYAAPLFPEPGSTLPPDSPLAIVLIESYAENAGERTDRRKALLEHAAIALTNAVETESRWIRYLTSRSLLVKVAAAACVLALAACIAAIPAEFKIEARGELQPLTRRQIFAPLDGRISEILVEQNARVQKGQVLARLESPPLEQEIQQVRGEQETTRRKIESLEALQISNESEIKPLESQRLAAEVLELRERLASAEKQLAILMEQREGLTVRAPGPGQVVTWDVRQRLDKRPVRRGQALMTVVDPDGPWVAEIQAPDVRIRHILRAARAESRPLDVSFVLASDPGTIRQGVVRTISSAVSMRHGEPFVRLTADVDRNQIEFAQPGTTVVAQVHCGSRPLGYVWTHELLEAIQTWLFF